ncbi:hypothetical protein CUMW_191100 [Citrus unshiu]|uniref:Peptidase C1A papain C-terminal domain-containing protein n=1 Tax=Citrus unshiu TaxID=55188 RepID=A0A2H5Q2X0_CITUN|nr:hypothetical protein CUMW_191100 [Citrus unshiu]
MLGEARCSWAFSAVAEIEGINQLTAGTTTETNYSYKIVDGKCNTKAEANNAPKINGYEDVSANSKTALMKVVANQRVSVAIYVGGFAFQFYSSGVFTGACSIDLDHGSTLALEFWGLEANFFYEASFYFLIFIFKKI